MVINIGYGRVEAENYDKIVKKVSPQYVDGLGYAVTVNSLVFPHTDGALARELNIKMRELDKILIKFNGDTRGSLWIKDLEDCQRCCDYINENILK